MNNKTLIQHEEDQLRSASVRATKRFRFKSNNAEDITSVRDLDRIFARWPDAAINLERLGPKECRAEIVLARVTVWRRAESMADALGYAEAALLQLQGEFS